jgi:hypothetical protein
MMGRRAIRRGGLALCLASVLMMTGLGCQPAGSSAPSTNKPADQKPEKKPSEQPKPDPG